MPCLTYIIDGYNLIKSPNISLPSFPDLKSGREHLLRLLKSATLPGGSDVIVVFDGTGRSTQQVGKVKIIFTSTGTTADTVIQRKIRSKAHRQRFCVVSSDRAIQLTARDHGCPTLTVEEFWRLLHGEPGSSPGNVNGNGGEKPEISDAEVDKWLQLFRNRGDSSDED